jgi:hypothetical protein
MSDNPNPNPLGLSDNTLAVLASAESMSGIDDSSSAPESRWMLRMLLMSKLCVIALVLFMAVDPHLRLGLAQYGYVNYGTYIAFPLVLFVIMYYKYGKLYNDTTLLEGGTGAILIFLLIAIFSQNLTFFLLGDQSSPLEDRHVHVSIAVGILFVYIWIKNKFRLRVKASLALLGTGLGIVSGHNIFVETKDKQTAGHTKEYEYIPWIGGWVGGTAGLGLLLHFLYRDSNLRVYLTTDET